MQEQSHKYYLDFRVNNVTDNPAKNLTLFPDLENNINYSSIIKSYFEKIYAHY